MMVIDDGNRRLSINDRRMFTLDDGATGAIRNVIRLLADGGIGARCGGVAAAALSFPLNYEGVIL